MTRKVDWTAVAVVVTVITAIFGGWQAREAWRANQKADEQINISVDRNYWNTSVVLDTGLVSANMPPILVSKWLVEIYNTSANTVTIKNVIPIGYNAEIALSSILMDANSQSTNDIEPFSIPAGDHKRMELQINVPLPRALSKIVTSCNCKSFDDFRNYMRSKGLDELGNFSNFDGHGLPTGFDVQHPPQNAGVLIRIESATGRSYLGHGKWYPGLELPRFPG